VIGAENVLDTMDYDRDAGLLIAASHVMGRIAQERLCNQGPGCFKVGAMVLISSMVMQV
jgi:hypothetical protein